MNTPTTCPQCGTELPANTVRGLCPKCLALVAMESGSEDKTMILHRPAEGTVQPALNSTLHYFGDYELLEEIARGGMGVVFKARQVRLNRTVAVKMILSGQLAGEAEVKRFHTEAEAAANLQHPNIVAIHEVGEHEGRHYFSMDYIEGENLAEFLKNDPLSATQAAQLMKTIAEAIHFAHQRGTLHRDLKPHNILIDKNGVPHITDFGLAKRVETDSGLTQSGAVMGSPAYMPPEQATGRNAEVGPASDVYSLGAILYQMLTGKAPFSGASAMDTLRQVIEQEPIAPSKINDNNPADLETICLKCLEKKPEQRYSSARAFADELERFLNHQPILAKPASVARKTLSWLARHPWVLTGVASIAVLALTGLAFGLWERTQFLEWDKAHPGQSKEITPMLPMGLLWLLITPFFLSLFLVWTVKDLRPGTGWPYRLHATLIGLAGSLTVLSGIYLAMQAIRELVWNTNIQLMGNSLLSLCGVLIYTVGFTWIGSTLLWRLGSIRYARERGLSMPAAAPSGGMRLGKIFWIILVLEVLLVNLLSHWVVVPGQWPGGGTFSAEWDKSLRSWFVMTSFLIAMVPLFASLGFHRRGNARWGFFFIVVLLLLSAAGVVSSFTTLLGDYPKASFEHAKMIVKSAVLTGAIAGGGLTWAARIRKK